ncbi:hypothetical protein HPK02_00025 [Anoxybacillus flavithermus]|uniref:DUF5659 domain-containing protein n=1 Tax=Anoxybacillus flavithermus TaxID=33934 RepID=UPI00186682DD|nr:DUF5659 domain-containing protein [Anoxybacillus flavithermus]MBE2917313.1 hypothetical protein [Anoxybacillus flavithermus]
MKTIKIYSLNVAAYLKSNGFDVVKFEKENSKTVFYFNDSDLLQKFIKKYQDDIELRKFISAYKDIREMTKQS